jgi:hypothetical protein
MYVGDLSLTSAVRRDLTTRLGRINHQSRLNALSAD